MAFNIQEVFAWKNRSQDGIGKRIDQLMFLLVRLVSMDWEDKWLKKGFLSYHV